MTERLEMTKLCKKTGSVAHCLMYLYVVTLPEGADVALLIIAYILIKLIT